MWKRSIDQAKIPWFNSGKQINHLPQHATSANNYLRVTDKSRLFAITECNNCFTIRSPGLLMNICHFAQHFVRVSFKHEHSIIYSQTLSQTQLGDIAHEQTIIFRQLFAGHVLGSRPMKRKKNLHQMIKFLINRLWSWVNDIARVTNTGKEGSPYDPVFPNPSKVTQMVFFSILFRPAWFIWSCP